MKLYQEEKASVNDCIVLIDSKVVVLRASEGLVTNLGSVYSEPLMTAYGSGDITLMVGMTVVELTGISGNVVLDSVLKEAYKGTTLMNECIIGDFPVLKPGINAVWWRGTVTRVVIQPHWRKS